MPADPFQLKRLSVSHEAIADWLIANAQSGPGLKTRCAATFGITQAWLSTIQRTDAFQAMMKAKQQDLHELQTEGLAEKINGLAHASIEKLGEVLDSTRDERLVRDIAKDALTMSGFGPSAAPATAGGQTFIDNSVTNVQVNSDALAAARERRTQHYGGNTLEGSSVPELTSDKTDTPQLSSNLALEVGEARDLRSQAVDRTKEIHGFKKEGGSV